MKSNLIRWAMLSAVLFAYAAELPAATVSVEVVATGRVQPTAHREWLQLLAGAGATNVRIRQGRGGERPEIVTLGAEAYQVIGVLASSDRLTLPGGSFGLRDTSRLRDYLDRLAKDGPERQTAATGNFGLTRDEFEDVFRDLGGSTLFPTAGLTLDELLAKAGRTLRHKIEFDPPAQRLRLQAQEKQSDELSDLTIGTVLAIALRREGLALVPEKPRGKPIRYRVTPNKPQPGAKKPEVWPVGYQPDARPREVAPAIMEFTNVEIDGYKLSEVIDVIGPRLKIPVLWDTAALAEHKIDPTTVDVKLKPSRRTYKSILRKLLLQAHLHGALRVDETGTAFYWITK